MFAGTDVVSERAIHQVTHFGHLLGVKTAGAQQTVNGFGGLEHFELPLGVGPLILQRIG